MVRQDQTKTRTQAQTVTTLLAAPLNRPAATTRTQVNETVAERFIRLPSEVFTSDQLRLSRNVSPGVAQGAELLNKSPHTNARSIVCGCTRWTASS
jgi:hypothetical protein